jgi:transposase/peptidoglycan/xylan/chitin deacetylase (PgdA/CDA1 family)
MAYNFVAADRDQLLLMPPSVAEWLPEDHLAWFVLDVVDELDLSTFVGGYRADGRGGAAYDPAMMVALLVYAYSVGERSSRSIERRCLEDVAFRVVAANRAPDHATVARFRATHETALGGLFAQVLSLCARAGVLRPGLVAVDGTKLAADASRDANRTAEQLAAEILAEAAATDAAEDERASADGEAALPEELRHRGGRRERLRRLLDELEAEADERSYEAHMARRAEIEQATGRPIRGRRPAPGSTTHRSRRHANTTDPDSRLLKTKAGYLQGYNAQAVTTEDQFVVAAEVTNNAHDAPSFGPMVAAAKENLRRAGERRRIRRVAADAGYWSDDNANLRGVEAFIAPGRARNLKQIAEEDHERSAVLARVEAGGLDKADAAAGLGVTRARLNQLLRRRRAGTAETLTTSMMAKLDTPRGRRIYRKRAASVEPVFGQIKHNRKMRSVSRRGVNAADSEWKLMTATHNLLKLWRLTATTA